jgi:hypothetical protein
MVYASGMPALYARFVGKQSPPGVADGLAFTDWGHDSFAVVRGGLRSSDDHLCFARPAILPGTSLRPSPHNYDSLDAGAGLPGFGPP